MVASPSQYCWAQRGVPPPPPPQPGSHCYGDGAAVAVELAPGGAAACGRETPSAAAAAAAAAVVVALDSSCQRVLLGRLLALTSSPEVTHERPSGPAGDAAGLDSGGECLVANGLAARLRPALHSLVAVSAAAVSRDGAVADFVGGGAVAGRRCLAGPPLPQGPRARPAPSHPRQKNARLEEVTPIRWFAGVLPAPF